MSYQWLSVFCDSESEWMFSCDEGRLQLHRNAGFERLLVVTLNREHNYNSLDDVKAELSNKVLELAPLDVSKQVIMVHCSVYWAQLSLLMSDSCGMHYAVAALELSVSIVCLINLHRLFFSLLHT